MPSQPRGEKHARAQSTTSRDAKRLRDDETNLSEMSVDPAILPQEIDADENAKGKGSSHRKLGKRRQESEEEEESTTELGLEDDEERSATIDDDEEWLVQQSSRNQKSGKVARTNDVDSPSKLKRRVKKGKRDPFITSPSGSKAPKKRVLDDADDHEIGDKWTDLNGLRWEMGEDRELRREAVVMEMRLKYPNMPKDSRHPDAKVKIPVFVEKFLTEEEYEDMKSKKLLGFQEEERQREIEEAEEKRRKHQEEESKARQKAIAEKGERTIATPKKVRDVQALYQSPFRKPASVSPLRGVLPLAMQRSRSVSSVSSKNSSTSTILPSPSIPYKRLSLSMGSADGVSSSPKPPVSPGISKEDVNVKTKRSTNSFRIPLSSPSSSRLSTNQAPNSSPSPLKRILGSLGSIVARTKREESLLRILKEEDERKKKREASTVKS